MDMLIGPNLTNSASSEASFKKLGELERRSGKLTDSKSLSSEISPEEREQVKKLAGDFESIFLNLVFKTMRDTVPEDGGVLDSSNGEKIFRSMLDNEYAKNMAEQNSTGLGDMIARDLLQTMETQKASQGLKAYKKL